MSGIEFKGDVANSPGVLGQLLRDVQSHAGGSFASPEQEQAYKTLHSMKMMSKGGSASSRADGIAQRGKTRGKMK